MAGHWNQLDPETKNYWNSRFAKYNLDGEEAYEQLLSEEAKQLDSDELQEFLKQKDISHIIPQSEAPELADKLSNVYLEDTDINRARGAEISSQAEWEEAWADQQFDAAQIQEGNISDYEPIGAMDLSSDLWDEIVSISLGTGILMSAHQTGEALEKGTISLSEAPRYFTIKGLGKAGRFALIGFCLSSGSPIIVSAGIAYLIYKLRAFVGQSAKIGAYLLKLQREGKLQTAVEDFVTTNLTLDKAQAFFKSAIEQGFKAGGRTLKGLQAGISPLFEEETRNTLKKKFEKSGRRLFQNAKDLSFKLKGINLR